MRNASGIQTAVNKHFPVSKITS